MQYCGQTKYLLFQVYTKNDKELRKLYDAALFETCIISFCCNLISSPF